jgi:hypothetical protein
MSLTVASIPIFRRAPNFSINTVMIYYSGSQYYLFIFSELCDADVYKMQSVIYITQTRIKNKL